jgi:hypothetical protein
VQRAFHLNFFLQLAISVLACPVCVLAYVAFQFGLFSGS